MKKIMLIAVVMSLLSTGVIGQTLLAQPGNPVPVIIPQPQKVVMGEGTRIIKENIIWDENYNPQEVRIKKASNEFLSLVMKANPNIMDSSFTKPIFLGVVGYNAKVAAQAKSENLTIPQEAEGYALSVSPRGVTLIGRDYPGLFHGLMTLRQLLQIKDKQVSLPYIKVEDYPKLSLRGVHFFTGKDALQEQKALIDVMALYKMNFAVMQLDFMEFKSHPELWYPVMGQRQSEIKELIQYAKDRYIEISPMVNTPGHAEWIFRNKVHLDLAEDANPTKEGMAPYAIYVANDSTYKFLFELYDEVVDLFKPRYFHIGHDEPDLPNYVKFPNRSKGYTTHSLLQLDLKKNNEYFKGKKIDIMLWGDIMLFRGESPDACNAPTYDIATGFRSFLKTLEAQRGAPKYIINDWHYASRSPERYRSLQIFADAGFPVLACPWYGPDNIRNFSQQAITTKSLGLLQTTWAGFNFSISANTTCHEQFVAYLLAADYSWSGRKEKHTDLGYDSKEVFWKSFNGFKDGSMKLSTD